MPISFEPSEGSLLAQAHYRQVALEQMRPISRRYDLAEHTLDGARAASFVAVHGANHDQLRAVALQAGELVGAQRRRRRCVFAVASVQGCQARDRTVLLRAHPAAHANARGLLACLALLAF